MIRSLPARTESARCRPLAPLSPAATRHAGGGAPLVLVQAVLAAVAWSATASAQVQFAALDKRALPATPGGASCTAVGDVDGDGDPDVICGSFGQNRLYRNDGNGIFADATAACLPPALDLTLALVLGDVDGDGDLDLVCGNLQQNRLLRNDGSGVFTDVTAACMPIDAQATTAVVLGDVDGDGDLDLICANTGYAGTDRQDRLYRNDGTGVFTDVTATHLPVDDEMTRGLVLGDVDNDGDQDLVRVNSYSYGWGAQNRLYVNDGTGHFTDATSTRMPIDNDLSNCVVMGDVDADGDLDFVVGNGLGYGYGAGANRIYLNDGTGAFAFAPTGNLPIASDALALAFGDADGDGTLDLACANGDQDRLYRNDGTGVFSDVTATNLPGDTGLTTSTSFADVDGDGDLDLVRGGTVDNGLWLNDGAGAFVDAHAPRLPPSLAWTSGVALGDIDGDGDLDAALAVSWPPGNLDLLYRNDGSGRFADLSVNLPAIAGTETLGVALGDVDGDGDLDLVHANRNQQNRLYLNDGTGVFTDLTAPNMPPDADATHALLLVDLDGDGRPEIVCANQGQDRLYRNNGSGTFVDLTATHMPVDLDTTYALAVGDVDGDGDPDLVFGNQTQNRLYRNDGGCVFTDVTATHLPPDFDITTAVVLGDVDGDGDLDLITGCSGYPLATQDLLYVNDGTGVFQVAGGGGLPPTSGTSSLALVDVDGNGTLDLIAGHDNTLGNGLQNRLYLNTGGLFVDATAARMPADADYTKALALGDVDGDGDPDLVFGNSNGPRLHLNLQRQLDAPHLLRVGRTYTLEAYCRYGPPSQVDFAIPWVSTTPLHVPWPPLGTIGALPEIWLPTLVIPQPDGVAGVAVAVPNNPAIAGIEVYGQALLWHYPLQERLTNVTLDVIQ